jgi:hypothetical protein
VDASGSPVPASDEERRVLGGEAARRLHEAGHDPRGMAFGALVEGEIDRALLEAGADGVWRRAALFPGRYAVLAGAERADVEVAAGEEAAVSVER